MRKTKNLTRKHLRKTQKRRSKKHLKLVGGDDTECPICLEEQEKATLRPCGHTMCMDCFSRMTKKNCSLCRVPIEQMVKITTDDNGDQIETIVWPEQIDSRNVNKNINIIMNRMLRNVPRSIPWSTWSDNINANGSPFIQEFKEQFASLNENELAQTYKHFRNHPPTIIFSDVAKEFVKYYKNQTGQKIKVTAKMDANLIREFLAYTLVVEAPVRDYKNRINEYFGWPNY